MNFFTIILVLLGNLWIWKVLSSEVLLGLILISTSVFLYFGMVRKNKNYSFIFVVLFVLLLVFQLRTTSRVSLTELSNDEQRIQAMRLREYPSAWLRVGHWFEERPESIAFFRILNNFSEVIDPNLYFFANHPRERVGVKEFEKFPYIFLPAFVIGILILAERKKKVFLLSLILPFTVLTLKGSDNPLGPYTLFPAVSVAIATGMKFFYDNLKNKRVIILAASILIIAVLIQTLAYERF